MVAPRGFEPPTHGLGFLNRSRHARANDRDTPGEPQGDRTGTVTVHCATLRDGYSGQPMATDTLIRQARNRLMPFVHREVPIGYGARFALPLTEVERANNR